MHYRTTCQATRQLISARLKEGFTVNDFKTVIDKKSAEWLGTKMVQYLRPSTLFGNKFESYLNTPFVEGTQSFSENHQMPEISNSTDMIDLLHDYLGGDAQ